METTNNSFNKSPEIEKTITKKDVIELPNNKVDLVEHTTETPTMVN